MLEKMEAQRSMSGAECLSNLTKIPLEGEPKCCGFVTWVGFVCAAPSAHFDLLPSVEDLRRRKEKERTSEQEKERERERNESCFSIGFT